MSLTPLVQWEGRCLTSSRREFDSLVGYAVQQRGTSGPPVATTLNYSAGFASIAHQEERLPCKQGERVRALHEAQCGAGADVVGNGAGTYHHRVAESSHRTTVA